MAEHPETLRRLAPQTPAPATRSSAPAVVSHGWVRRLLDGRQDALERAIGQLFGNERYRLGLRMAELERRLAELEERKR